MKEGLSVVILVHNEEKILEKNMLLLKEYIDNLDIDYEVILSENGSTDKTKEICNSLTNRFDNFRVVYSDIAAYGQAIRNGAKLANFSHLLVYPADLWGSLRFINEAIKAIDNHDIVLGSRFFRGLKQNRPLTRMIISKTHNLLVNILYRTKYKDIDCVKFYKTEIGKRILEKTIAMDPFIEVEIGVIMKKYKVKLIEIPFKHIEPKTRHAIFLLKMIWNGAYQLISEYSRLKNLKIE